MICYYITEIVQPTGLELNIKESNHSANIWNDMQTEKHLMPEKAWSIITDTLAKKISTRTYSSFIQDWVNLKASCH